MMIYTLDNDAIHKEEPGKYDLSESKSYLCLLTFKELEAERAQLGISEIVVCECLRNVTKFESHDGFDYIALISPAPLSVAKPISASISISGKTCWFLFATMIILSVKCSPGWKQKE